MVTTRVLFSGRACPFDRPRQRKFSRRVDFCMHRERERERAETVLLNPITHC